MLEEVDDGWEVRVEESGQKVEEEGIGVVGRSHELTRESQGIGMSPGAVGVSQVLGLSDIGVSQGKEGISGWATGKSQGVVGASQGVALPLLEITDC
jgi:hypothetical protein